MLCQVSKTLPTVQAIMQLILNCFAFLITAWLQPGIVRLVTQCICMHRYLYQSLKHNPLLIYTDHLNLLISNQGLLHYHQRFFQFQRFLIQYPCQRFPLHNQVHSPLALLQIGVYPQHLLYSSFHDCNLKRDNL